MELQEIERKHLQGMLSHEDARIARLLVTERKRSLANGVKHEKALLERQLDEYRRQQIQKLRHQVESMGDVAELAKMAKMRCIEQKQKTGE